MREQRGVGRSVVRSWAVETLEATLQVLGLEVSEVFSFEILEEFTIFALQLRVKEVVGRIRGPIRTLEKFKNLQKLEVFVKIILLQLGVQELVG